MPHRTPVPPEHSDSPASTFAPRQPGAVVGDDVLKEERGGKPTVSEATDADTKRMECERAKADKAQRAERERLEAAQQQMLRDREEAARLHRQAMDHPGTEPEDQDQEDDKG